MKHKPCKTSAGPTKVGIVLGLMALSGPAGSQPPASVFQQYVQPYADTNNFSGAVLVVRDGKVLFEKAYGYSDNAAKRSNTPDTQLHIASMSMQFTAAAVMCLVDGGKLSLSTHVGELAPDIPNGDRITVRQLLEETSGLPDINGFPEYEQILQQHQTPASLVQYVRGKAAAAEPGGSFRAEEHSAYNLLALIVEQKTGLPFAKAVNALVFAPLHMGASRIDDDAPVIANTARGYMPKDVRDVVPAQPLKWSAKTGNGSAVSTVRDESRWVEGFFGDRLLSPGTRATMLDYSKAKVGYGWFKNLSKRFETPIYYMNGRAPGFASFILHAPSEHLTVVVLGNLYASTPTTIGLDLAAIALGKPYELPTLGAHSIPQPKPDLAGAYHFGLNFYQPNSTLTFAVIENGATVRWPSGDVTALIPVAEDRFIDRAYWVPVVVKRGPDGRVGAVTYDGFQGEPLPAANPK